MNKRKIALLEKAFDAEITAALDNTGLFVVQTKSKLAAELEAEGLLRKLTVTMNGWPAIEITGYALTELGRMTYCMEYADLQEPA